MSISQFASSVSLSEGSRFPHPGTKKRDLCLAAKVSLKSQLETSARPGYRSTVLTVRAPNCLGELLPFDIVIIPYPQFRRNRHIDKSLTEFFVYFAGYRYQIIRSIGFRSGGQVKIFPDCPPSPLHSRTRCDMMKIP